jgi:hypothetical protein
MAVWVPPISSPRRNARRNRGAALALEKSVSKLQNAIVRA